jgi:proteic killer suppression protein
MIRSFRHRGIKQLFVRDDGSLLEASLIKRIKRLLDVLDSSNQIEGINYVGNHLHKLKGSRKGYWSLKVSGNWRITFRFEHGNAYDVNLEDYH